MKNRINTLFEQKQKDILSVYFTAGYPNLNDTVSIITELEKAGADLIEIGIPFSDPTADGPVIQQSSHLALVNGMNLNLLFNQLKNIRDKVSVPLILMGYFNPVYQFGVERFCNKCNETGIDGAILPDLPLWEFENNYQSFFEKNGIHNILLITPQTSDERILEIDNKTGGFIYMVSSSSTTGKNQKVEDFHQDYFNRVNSLGLKTPRLIGFGISDNQTFNKACENANGAIIGTAFINSFKNNIPLEKSITEFVKSVKNG
ncbi:MAG: tryptophan synthase subunit alpha [Prolixibacteraceae bacterium]|nr:tryptophan synthase subunit alpha [Prolixibacteraceae bacterium]MBN2775655.1 tryptophan synthase subunit alpha [Prolixibacteraceae bacterium]